MKRKVNVMKKLLSLALAPIPALALLGACGGVITALAASNGQPAAEPAASQEAVADTANHPNCKGNVTEYAWADAFYAQDPAMFAAMFHENISQAAGTSPSVSFGAETVAGVFAWASSFYQYCDFHYQAQSGNRTFLEWELLTKNNMPMTGVTIITKNSDGKIISAVNGHRNLMEVMLFFEHFFKGPEGVGAVHLVHTAAVEQYGLDAKYERKEDGTFKAQGVTDAYIDAFATADMEEFKKIFADEVVLDGGYIVERMSGQDNVAACLAEVANFYEHCIFTVQANTGNRTYLQYEGRLRNGMQVTDAFMVIVRDDNGMIIKVADNPVPLTISTILSAHLRESTDGILPKNYFYRDTLFAEAVEKYGIEGVYGDFTQ